MVRDGVISKVVSFPSGRNFIIRQIAKSFKVNFEIADSLLHLYIDNKADKDVITKMTSVLLNVKKEWLIYCENALADLSGGFAFPSVVFITSEDDVASIYEDFIKNSNVSSNPLPVFDQNADVIKIDTKLLANDYNPTPKFSYDEFIEHIPFAETRTYVKRVLSYFVTNQKLYEDKIDVKRYKYLIEQNPFQIKEPISLKEEWQFKL